MQRIRVIAVEGTARHDHERQGGDVDKSRTLLGGRARPGIVALLIALLLVWGDQSGAAAARRERHCFHPSGADMNEVHDTNHRIITDFCAVALPGERWIPVATWATNTTHEVIPEGYTPSRETPIEDFNAKLVGARYVIDAGTRHERTYSFSASQILQTGLTVPGSDFPMSAFIAVLHPLRPGAHTVDIFLTISADHWDGFGVDPSANLFPAGEIHCSRVEFTVRQQGH